MRRHSLSTHESNDILFQQVLSFNVCLIEKKKIKEM